MRRHLVTFAMSLLLAAAGCGGRSPASHGPAGGGGDEEAAPPVAPAHAPVAEPPPQGEQGAEASAVPPQPPPAATPLADEYRGDAQRILEEGLKTRGAWQRLAYLCDRIGARLAGSKQLDQAIAWAAAEMKQDGLENVRTEKVMVRHWVRGEERGEIVAPVAWELALMALGNSPGTGKKGVTAEVVVVDSLEALEALDDAAVKGKIVLFNKPMITDEKGPHYGEVSPVRGKGPALAARKGAVAALVRSLTSHSLRTPHTGGTWWGTDKKQRKIPAAAVSTEDADYIARLAASGPVRVKMVLGAKTLPDAPSANVIGELVGREKPEEIVLLGAHLDSWDVGQGAHDDGAGCVAMMEAVAILKRLGLRPRRTIRVVLFTNEELGLEGAEQYVKDHAAELPNHVAAVESDIGGGRPMGFMLQAKEGDAGGARMLGQLADLVTLLAPIDASRARLGFGGADIDALADAGAKTWLIGHWVDASHYFDVHHTEADTLDKVDPEALQKNAVALAVLAWVLAEMPERPGAAAGAE